MSLVKIDTLFEELHEMAIECREAGWDGYGSLPIKPETINLTKEVLRCIPYGVSLPDFVGAEPDGDVTLEWYKTTNCLISVSISPDNYLYYASLLNGDACRGKSYFTGVIPEVVLLLINQVKS